MAGIGQPPKAPHLRASQWLQVRITTTQATRYMERASREGFPSMSAWVKHHLDRLAGGK